MVNSYIAGKSLTESAAAVNLSIGACRNALRFAGVPTRTRTETALNLIDVRNDAFEEIRDEETAYWLGFLAADGCVSGKAGAENHVSLKLQIQDKGHVEKFANWLQTSCQVGVYRNKGEGEYAMIRITSLKMAQDLIRLGLTPRKSLTLEPWDGPKHLMRHYWRGVIDGDGSLYVRKQDGSITVSLVGSLPMVSAFREFARSIVQTESKIRQRGKIYLFAIGGNYRAGRVVKEMYGTSRVSLDRKMSIAKKAMKNKSAPVYRSDIDTNALVKDYLSGDSPPKLERKYGLAECAIINRLKKSGVKIRNRRETDALTSLKKAEVS